MSLEMNPDDFARNFTAAWQAAQGEAWLSEGRYSYGRYVDQDFSQRTIWQRVEERPAALLDSYWNVVYKVSPINQPENDRPIVQLMSRSVSSPVGVDEYLCPLSVLRVLDLFVPRAPDLPSLTTVTDRYVEWSRDNEEEGRGNALRGLGGIIAHSLVLAPEVYDDLQSPFLDVLARLTPEYKNYDLTRASASIFFGRMLTDRFVNPNRLPVAPQLEYVSNSSLVRAADCLDGMGLVVPGFWMAHGIRAGVAYKSADVLDVVHRKSVENEQVIFDEKGSERINIINEICAYVDGLLGQYAEDPLRDQAQVRRIITTIRRQNRTGLDFSQLIAVGNGVARGLNRRFAEQGLPVDRMLAELDHTDPRNIGDALVRVLYFTPRADVDPEIRDQQFEQDMKHVDIIEQLYSDLRARRSSEADVRLRHHPLEDADFTELMGDLDQSGMNRARGHTYFRRKHRTESKAVRAHMAKKPGYGLLS